MHKAHGVHTSHAPLVQLSCIQLVSCKACSAPSSSGAPFYEKGAPPMVTFSAQQVYISLLCTRLFKYMKLWPLTIKFDCPCERVKPVADVFKFVIAALCTWVCEQVYDTEQETYITFDEAMQKVTSLEQQQEGAAPAAISGSELIVVCAVGKRLVLVCSL
eukprot:1145348-Pelagomonas_calceolata.AAC.2